MLIICTNVNSICETRWNAASLKFYPKKKRKMGFWDIPNLKLYGILTAIFIPFLAIKIWTDLKSKFGILIFLKFNDRSKIGEALVEIRKCFEKGSCVIFREYKQVKIEKYEFLRELSKYKSYSHILWER